MPQTKPAHLDTEGAIARSYQLLALLEVCVDSARHIDAGNLGDALKLAVEIAGEVHDALENPQAKEARHEVAQPPSISRRK
jgi:hypothetical protein